jgi:hypothetical protein
MEGFFNGNQKLLLLGSVFMLCCVFYEIYRGIGLISSNHIGQGSGALLTACVYLLVSVYFFIRVRNANRPVKEENAGAETNSIKSPEV